MQKEEKMSLESRNKRKERNKKIVERLADIKIPPFIFRNTPLSILEAIIDYLKIEQGLNFHEIGVLLDRDERNIWTVYHRAIAKKGC